MSPEAGGTSSPTSCNSAATQVVWIRSLLTAFGKLRESDRKYESCVYQWFYPHDPASYEQLRKLWKAGR